MGLGSRFVGFAERYSDDGLAATSLHNAARRKPLVHRLALSAPDPDWRNSADTLRFAHGCHRAG